MAEGISGRERVLMVALVVLVAMNVLMAGLVLMDDGDSDENDVRRLNVGDSFHFIVSGDISGNIWINVTEKVDGNCTLVMKGYYGQYPVESMTFHLREDFLLFFWYDSEDRSMFEDGLVGRFENGTAFGPRMMDHYHYESGTRTFDLYYGTENGMLYKYWFTTSNTSYGFELVDATVDWV